MKLLVGKIFHRLRVLAIPYAWYPLSRLLNALGRETCYPEKNFGQAYLIVSDLDHEKRKKIPGIDLTDSAFHWLRNKTNNGNVTLITDKNVGKISSSDVVVVCTYDWISSYKSWTKFLITILKLGTYCRKRKIPIWILVADTYAQEHALPISLLVAISGGAIVVQHNTQLEAKHFGLTSPVGPVLWTLNTQVLKNLGVLKDWSQRENLAILAGTGDARRMELMSKLGNFLVMQGVIVESSRHEKSYDVYLRDLSKARFVATTCLVQVEHLKGPSYLRGRISKETVTHRAWEGFAVGAVVITNDNHVFQKLGFVSGRHFIDINDCVGGVSEVLELFNPDKLSLISRQGQELFASLIV